MTPDDRAVASTDLDRLQVVADELTYSAALKSLKEVASGISTKVATVATLVTVGGLTSLSTILADGPVASQILVFVSAALGAIAVILALAYQTEFVRKIDVDNLRAVADYLTKEFQKTRLVVAAQILVLLAAITGFFGGAIAVYEEQSGPEDSTVPQVTASVVPLASDDPTKLTFNLNVVASATDIKAGEATTLSAGIKDDPSSYGMAVAVADAAGTTCQKLEVSKVDNEATVSVSYKTPKWDCTVDFSVTDLHKSDPCKTADG
ncbi:MULTISPECIES: hypothetical protein [Actinomycetes]|uniref:hypothetical protein n=1 Tax=Actinomycetes TaxID=1760 RepID=UPI0004C18ECE|nr:MULTISPECIES: hypothetical protein [Actinomycetes]